MDGDSNNPSDSYASANTDCKPLPSIKRMSEEIDCIWRRIEELKVEQENLSHFGIEKQALEANEILVKLNEILNKSEDRKVRIEEIFGLVGNTTATGTQKEYADKAGTTANKLQKLSTIFMLTGSVAAIIITFCSMYYSKEESLIGWFFRISSVVPIFVTAFYVAREGRKQRESEDRYRELQIKIAAIPAYFSDIDSENKNHVRLELAKNLLSREDHRPEKEGVFLSAGKDGHGKITVEFKSEK